MSIWKISTSGPAKVAETKLEHEKLKEESLEDWIVSHPDILEEPLLIVGRQVKIPDLGDRIDILALDPDGNSVIIELKRGKIQDPIDMQALRYASYIAKWSFEDFSTQARIGKPDDFNFNDRYENFCAEQGIDKVPDITEINSEQRIIIVGAEVKDKLGSVALWLHQHSIDIKVVEVEAYREGDNIFIQPQVIIPLPVRGFEKTGSISANEGARPWISDGQSWHLEKRCSPKTKEIFLKLNEIIGGKFDVNGPIWNQKFYIAYRIGNYIWLAIQTHPTALILEFVVKAGIFKTDVLAQQLGIVQYDTAETLSQKLGLPTSISVFNRNAGTDRVSMRLKEDFDINSPAFLKFLLDANKAFPKGP